MTISIDALDPFMGGAEDSSSQPIRILFVEDHEESRRTLSRLLTLKGFKVTETSSVSLAKRAIEEQGHFNLMISDIGLGDGTGFELMRWVRRKSPELPAIALTAYDSEKDLEKTLSSGFSAHLTKPVTIEALIDAVDVHALAAQ